MTRPVKWEDAKSMKGKWDRMSTRIVKLNDDSDSPMTKLTALTIKLPNHIRFTNETMSNIYRIICCIHGLNQ